MPTHASNLLQIITQKGLQNVHIISHDMGDTVLTEAISMLEERGIRGDFKSLTFTNGGMVFEEIGLRLGQKILLGGYGEVLVKVRRIGFAMWSVLIVKE